MTYNLIFNSAISKKCRQKLRDLFERHHNNFENICRIATALMFISKKVRK